MLDIPGLHSSRDEALPLPSSAPLYHSLCLAMLFQPSDVSWSLSQAAGRRASSTRASIFDCSSLHLRLPVSSASSDLSLFPPHLVPPRSALLPLPTSPFPFPTSSSSPGLFISPRARAQALHRGRPEGQMHRARDSRAMMERHLMSPRWGSQECPSNL